MGGLKLMRNFKERFSHNLMNIVNELAMPWFIRCVEKYGEEEWHRRMRSSWNLYDDWQEFHREKYRQIIIKLRRIRRFIAWDNELMCNYIIKLLEEQGWKVFENEKKKILDTIEKVRRDIYEE
ncbi:MAG: hypothetical protein QXO37_06900 [Candidatus Nitrosocaldaceae archaeon]